MRDNQVLATGGDTPGSTAIAGSADIIDNLIDGVAGAQAAGIGVDGDDTEVRGNRIRNFFGSELAYGISIVSHRVQVLDNRITNMPEILPEGSAAIWDWSGASFCRDNIMAGFTSGLVQCEDLGGNVLR